MRDRGPSDQFDEIRAARTALEAALAVSESEAARAAWRLYHHALAERKVRAVGDARRLLDETIVRSDDEQLIEAKRRYDSAQRVSPDRSSSQDAVSVAPGRERR